MNTYTSTFCNCGRIHIHPDKDIDWMSEECKTRRVLHVCKNCGATYLEFLTEKFPDSDKPEFYINGCSVIVDQDIDPNGDIKYRIHITDGIQVPMRDGNYANYYRNCKFCYIDPETPYAKDESTIVDKSRLISDIYKKYKDELEYDDIENIIKAIDARVSNIN